MHTTSEVKHDVYREVAGRTTFQGWTVTKQNNAGADIEETKSGNSR